MQFGQQFHTLAMQIDMALQLLVNAIDLHVVSEGSYLSLLQSLGKERKRLLQQFYVAMVDDLLQSLQLLIAGAQRSHGLMLGLRHLQFGALLALACCLHLAAIAIQWKANANENAIDGLPLLGVSTVAQ